MTACGAQHTENEDSFVVRPDLGLFAVADGISRDPGGAVASSLAVQTLEQSFERRQRRRPTVGGARWRLAESFLRASVRVWHAAQEHAEYGHMATTLAAMVIAEDRVVLGHVGDSHIYRVRRREVERLTMNHTVAEDAEWRAENADEPDLSDPTKQQLLTRVIGRGEVDVAIRVEKVEPEDVYLLCTDGLDGVLNDYWIEAPLIQVPQLVRLMDKIVGPGATVALPHLQCAFYLKRVKDRGTPDDVTMIIARFTAKRRCHRLRTERGDGYVVHAPPLRVERALEADVPEG
jgi:protein phosphatase